MMAEYPISRVPLSRRSLLGKACPELAEEWDFRWTRERLHELAERGIFIGDAREEITFVEELSSQLPQNFLPQLLGFAKKLLILQKQPVQLQ